MIDPGLGAVIVPTARPSFTGVVGRNDQRALLGDLRQPEQIRGVRFRRIELIARLTDRSVDVERQLRRARRRRLRVFQRLAESGARAIMLLIHGRALYHRRQRREFSFRAPYTARLQLACAPSAAALPVLRVWFARA
jgi:hypothetical protein